MKGWRKPALIALAVAPIGVAVFSFGFMAYSEYAFDEARCPYAEGTTREITDSVSVREDQRRCQDEVEEHRWVILREGAEPLEVGRRRLASTSFADGYRWEAADQEGRVRLEIYNPGMDVRIFREPERESGEQAQEEAEPDTE